MRALLGLLVTLLSGCASVQCPWMHPYRPTVVVDGLTCCAKHRIPTISIIGYHSVRTHDKLVLVHDWDPQALKCNPDSPNRLADDSKFDRTSIHRVRGIITFCRLCDPDYWHCRGGDHQLTDEDVQQITTLAMGRPGFRRPIIRIFAVYSPNAVAFGGAQERVGDVFTDIGVKKRGGKWVIAYPMSSHRVVAIGRDDL